jgi:hypothetical protein
MISDIQAKWTSKHGAWEKQSAHSRLSEVCEKFLNACPLHIRHISVGEPAKEILKLIKEEDIDIVTRAIVNL